MCRWLAYSGEPLQTSTVILDGEMQVGDTIAVTVEPQGGSPNGEPSGEPIVAIPTA